MRGALLGLVIAAALVRPAIAQDTPTEIPAAPPAKASAGERLFLQALRTARGQFYESQSVDWDALKAEFLPRVTGTDRKGISSLINEALSRLHASHTAHYTPDQRQYYELLDVFYPDGVPAGWKSAAGKPAEYVGIGLATTVIDGRVHALDVYEGGPAAKAGVQVGDELLSVEGEPWGDVAPFRKREGVPTHLLIRRTADGEPAEVVVMPESIQPRQMFLRSMLAGARIIKTGECAVAYVRVRSYAHEDYHDRLKKLLEKYADSADALVLDFRGGWGGARPEYMDIFNPVAPRVTQEMQGTVEVVDPTWRKPVALLIDGGTRSGKEILAFAIKKHRIATLVGTRTAGAVLGGTPYRLSDSSMLMVAVSNVWVDGVRLEGVGVEPDVAVERPISYCGGADTQLEAALAHLSQAVHGSP